MKNTKVDVMAIDEMAIVDIFTKLIFDAEAELNHRQSAMVALLCEYEPSLASASPREISEYLRSMAVSEMIVVVGHIKQRYDQGHVVSGEKSFHRQSSARH